VATDINVMCYVCKLKVEVLSEQDTVTS